MRAVSILGVTYWGQVLQSHIRNDSRRREGGPDALGAGAGTDLCGVGGPSWLATSRYRLIAEMPRRQTQAQRPSLAHVFPEWSRSATHLLPATRRYGYRLVEIVTHFGGALGHGSDAFLLVSSRRTFYGYNYHLASQGTQILHQLMATNSPIHTADSVYNLVGNLTSSQTDLAHRTSSTISWIGISALATRCYWTDIPLRMMRWAMARYA